jgi:hypothetical protein
MAAAFAAASVTRPIPAAIAVSLFTSEHDFSMLHAFVFDKAGDTFEAVKAELDAIDGPVPVRRISIKMITKEISQPLQVIRCDVDMARS